MLIEDALKQIANILQEFEASTNNGEIVDALIVLNELSYSYNGERFIIIKSNDEPKETAKSKIRMSVIVNKDHIKSLEKADEVIDQIYDELEAQLKAKDEEIEMLQCRLYHAEGYIKDIHEPKDTK